MKHLLVFTMLSIIISAVSTLQAAPTVSGNVISWPDNGWYQVQLVNDDGTISVCEGGSSCKVSQGNYIVINHSTGERFTDISVNSISEPSETINVNGTTISWPNDGWYQVQDSTTYESVCNGGDSCDVLPGNYVVINHSTGERFNNILVGIQNNPISVEGNTIIWPDNGWYQVQRSDTYENICNGGASCQVPNGIYTVINHSTGDRYRNIEVRVRNQNEGEVPFSEIVGGDLAFTSDLTFNQPRYQVIRSNDALNSLYYGALTPPCPACDIALFDFDFFGDSIVVLVAHEIVSSGGYGIRIENAVVDGGKLTVNVLKTSPGQNCIVTTAFTGPFTLYKIDGLHDQVEFVERTVQDAACN